MAKRSSQLGSEVWLDRLGPILVILVSIMVFAGKARLFTHVHDSVKYAAGAQAFTMGLGYTMPVYETGPSQRLYPPLQSAILSIGWNPAVSYTANRDGMLLVSLALSVISLLGCYWFWRIAGVPAWPSLLLLCTLAFHDAVVLGTMCLATDIGFIALFCALASVWWRAGRASLAWPWLVTGVGLSLALLWRSAALAAVGAGILFSVVVSIRARNLRPLVLLVTPLLVTLAFSLFQPWGLGGYVSVATEITGGRAQSLLNIVYTGCVELFTGRTILAAISPGLRIAEEVISRHVPGAGPVLGILVAVGAWLGAYAALRGFRRQSGVFCWALLGGLGLYAIQILAAPWGILAHYRYFMPVIILLVPWVWDGIATLSSTRLRSAVLWSGGVTILVVTALNAKHCEVKFREHQRVTDIENVRGLVAEARKELPPEARLAVTIGAPVLDVVEIWGRPVLPDYIRCGADLREPAYHRVLGFPRADFLLSRDSAEGDPRGLLTLHRQTPTGTYRLVRIDPVAEAEFRRLRGIPPPQGPRAANPGESPRQ
jgi:hypothetical protein